jgi:cyclophilin family peptidyl-prolyl cis-trans isomerase
MKYWLQFAASVALFSGLLTAQDVVAQQADDPQVTLHTSLGDIRLKLYQQQAPASVENFLQYARDGYYDGTVFHRVISHFMIQGGGMTADMTPKPTRDPIANEADNGLKNLRGTIAMARTSEPQSATSQFFINVQANPVLDYTGTQDSRSWGYAVFGNVIEGMNVVDDIRFVETGYGDKPVNPVTIESVTIH